MKYESKILDGKMMLISRDIKIGDEVWNPVMNRKETVIKDASLFGSSETITDLMEVEQCNSFKVIGEISSQATWIVEGDEFELKHFNPLSGADIEHKRSTKQIIRIKGPCGHYH
jgi:hypothetical protein